MTCDDFQTAAARFWRTTRAERVAIARHYVECPTCRADVELAAAEDLPDLDREELAAAVRQAVTLAVEDATAADPELRGRPDA